MTIAARDNSGKPKLSELHWFNLEGLAKHMERGRIKYPDTPNGAPNWTLGGKPLSEYLDAIERHMSRLVKGEWLDPETGTRHLDAIAWNALTAGTVALGVDEMPLYSDPE